MKKEDIEQPTMMVCVSKTWGKNKTSEVTGKRVSLEDCARGYWKLAGSARTGKAGRAKCLMAFDKGVIVGVWKIGGKGWMRCEESPKKTWSEDLDSMRDAELRRVCELQPVDRKIWNKYVGVRIHDIEGLDARGGCFRYTDE